MTMGISWARPGSLFLQTTTPLRPEAYIWKTSLNSVMTVLPDLGGGQAEATGINSSDEVVGWSIKAVTMASPKQYSHAVLWRSISKATDLNGELPTPTSPTLARAGPPGVLQFSEPKLCAFHQQ